MVRPQVNPGPPASNDPAPYLPPPPHPTVELNQNMPAEVYPPAAVPYPPPNNANMPPTHQPEHFAHGTPVVSFPPVDHNMVTPQRDHMHVQNAGVGEPWSTGLFECELNGTNALMTACFPFVTFGQVSEILDQGQTSCVLGSFIYILTEVSLLSWIIGSSYRRKMREKYNLVEAPYEDWVVHLFCPFCALCQEYRELEKRGYDPSLGWMGHIARQQQQAQMAPPMNQFMNE